MAWVNRGPYRYYCRSVREGKAVRRVHYGNGTVAELAAEADELRRAGREQRARAWREEVVVLGEADALAERLGNAADLACEAALTTAGYHRHDRGSWRRRRVALKDENMTTELAPAADVREVLGRAERGDRTALPALRGLLDTHPQVWRHWGDLAAHARAAWVDLATGPNLVLGETLARKMEALGDVLSGPAPTPLERLLVDRVVLGWLQAHHADAAAAQAAGRELTPAQFGHLQKRQERAQRSYLAAAKALALVRKLLPAAAKPRVGDRPVDAGDTEHPGVERGRPARPGKARPGPPERGRRGASEAAAKGRKGPGREAVIPDTLRKRLRGMVGSEN